LGATRGSAAWSKTKLLDVLTLWRHDIDMSLTKRATIYLDSDLHRAVRLKAVESETSVSDLVNAAIRQSLAEDADDLAAFRARAKESNLDFEAFVKGLRRRGKL
jgi:hypothetical protein